MQKLQWLKNKSHNSDCSVLWLFAETLFLIRYQFKDLVVFVILLKEQPTLKFFTVTCFLTNQVLIKLDVSFKTVSKTLL